MTSSRSRLQTALAIAALLVLGAVIGVSADRLHHRGAAAIPAASIDQHEALDELDRLVTLRPEQRTRIESILATRQADIDEAWRNARSHIEATINQVMAEIEAVLDPDQVAPFRALVERLHGPDHLPIRH